MKLFSANQRIHFLARALIDSYASRVVKSLALIGLYEGMDYAEPELRNATYKWSKMIPSMETLILMARSVIIGSDG